MKNTVNERVVLLKKELELTDIEFCVKAEISTGTLFRIKNGEDVSSKVCTSITNAFNVNKEWLLTGKGKMFKDEIKQVSQTANNWREEAYSLMHEQLEKKDKLIEQLMNMLTKTGNFLQLLNETDRTEEIQPALRRA